MTQLQWQLLGKLKWQCPAVSLTENSKSLVAAVVIITTWSTLHSTVRSAHCSMCHIIQLSWRPQFQFYLNTFRRSEIRKHNMQIIMIRKHSGKCTSPNVQLILHRTTTGPMLLTGAETQSETFVTTRCDQILPTPTSFCHSTYFPINAADPFKAVSFGL